MDVRRELNRIQICLSMDAQEISNRPEISYVAKSIKAASENLSVIVRHLEHEKDAFAKLADEIERRVKKIAETTP